VKRREFITLLGGAAAASTARAIPGATLPELFAAQVARTPDADAVVFEDERLSYGEFDARSSQLARHLRGLGIARPLSLFLALLVTTDTLFLSRRI
jgi:non-ribosomal peptide synthetase component F